MGSQVGMVGSHQLRWDPGWDWWDPAYIPPQFLPGYVAVIYLSAYLVLTVLILIDLNLIKLLAVI